MAGIVRGTPISCHFCNEMAWSADELNSVICSYVSIDSTRMKGVDDLVVARNGKGRLKPQSPLASEDWGVVIV
jgi:hypothetical protein